MTDCRDPAAERSAQYATSCGTVQTGHSSGGRLRVVPCTPVQFPLQTLNRGVEFACPNRSGVGDPISGHHELRNLVGPILHRGQVFFRLAELSNREWVSILHPDSKCTDTAASRQGVRERMGYILKEASHEGGCTFSGDTGRLDRGVERAVRRQVLRIAQSFALSRAHSEAGPGETTGLRFTHGNGRSTLSTVGHAPVFPGFTASGDHLDGPPRPPCGP